MIYANKFSYRTTTKTLEEIEENEKDEQIHDALIGFIQAEKQDEDNVSKTETKLIKNLKWAAKKNGTNKIVLHSFAHLSLSKADEKVTLAMFKRAEKRLKNSDYEVLQTPFGYFLDLNIQAPGKSVARVFKEF